MKRIEYLLKHNRLLQKAYIIIFSCFFRFLGLFIKTNPKQILFQSLKGKNYGDSPYALFEAMKKDTFFAGYTYVWAFDDPRQYEVDGAKKVKLNSLQYFLTALKSGVWVANVNIERGLQFKKKEIVYLNTWHGCAPLKKDGNAQKGRSDYDFGNIDIICAGSDWQKSFFMDSMNAREDSIVYCGMPRNDKLYSVDSDTVCELKKKYGIPLEKTVILYAPTWREGDKGEIPFHSDIWKERLGKDYVILFRAHHLTCKAMDISFDEFIRDYSGQYDVNELMMMSDILITDYSSILADFSILERPILLYAYDYEEYLKTRGLYKRLEELIPGNVFEDESALIEKIRTLDFGAESMKIKAFKNEYVYPYGDSTGKCLDCLKTLIKNERKKDCI